MLCGCWVGCCLGVVWVLFGFGFGCVVVWFWVFACLGVWLFDCLLFAGVCCCVLLCGAVCLLRW